MRVIVFGLAALAIVIAVVLAREGEWWIGVPDGLFGLGVAWVAWASLHDEHHPAVAAMPSPPAAVEPQRRAS